MPVKVSRPTSKEIVSAVLPGQANQHFALGLVRAFGGGEIIETSEVTIDYVPAGSQREAGLFFTEDPREFSLELRPKSYEAP